MDESSSRTPCLAYTGHRPQKLGGYDSNNPTALWAKDRLIEVIGFGLEHGICHHITGGAQGVDNYAAWLIINWRDSGTDVFCIPEPRLKLLVAVPCANQDKMWPPPAQEIYRKMLQKADVVHCCSQDPYRPELMLARDRWMVDNCTYLVAVWDGSSGGTGHTVKYAQSIGRRIYRIDPVTRMVGWM